MLLLYITILITFGFVSVWGKLYNIGENQKVISRKLDSLLNNKPEYKTIEEEIKGLVENKRT